MKKNLFVTVFWLICSQLIISCTSSCGNTTEINPGKQVQSPPFPNIVTENLYSIDKYDGFAVYNNGVIESFGIDHSSGFNGALITSYGACVGGGIDYGIITFDISTLKYAKIRKAEISIYEINSMSCHETETESVEISELKVPDGDYHNWENCAKYLLPSGELFWYPDGCRMPGNYVTSSVSYPLASEDGDFWSNSSSQLADFINSKKEHYLSFRLSRNCIDINSQPTMTHALWEDGGNNSGTGNLPTLTITYEE